MNPPRQCSARRSDGQPCRARPTRASDPPLCPAHARQIASRRQRNPACSLEEVAGRVDRKVNGDLERELANVRLATRQVMAELHQELSPAEFARLVSLVFQGARTVAQLLRARHQLPGDDDEEERALSAAIGAALDDLAEELGLSL